MNLGELVIAITLNKRGFDRGVRETQQQAGKLSAALGKIGGVMAKSLAVGAAAAVAAVGTLSKASLGAYAQYEQLTGGVKKLFGTASKEVMGYASRAFMSSGLSANQYMETVTNFSASLINSLGGDTAKAAKLADKAIRDMSDNANTFGTDISSIQNAYSGFAKGNFTMLDNLKLGYGGTKTEMQRLIKDANALRKAQGKNADLTIEKYSDIIEAIHTIQEQQGIADTTAKEATTTIEGSLNMLSGAWQNLVTGFGDQNKNVSALADHVVDAFGFVVENVVPRIGSIAEGMATAFDQMANRFPFVMQRMLPKILRIIPSISRAFKGVIKTVVKVLPSILKVVGEMVGNLVPAVADIIPDLVTAIASALPAVGGALATALTNLMNTLAPQLPGIVEGLVEGIADAIGSILSNLPELASAGLKIVEGLAKGIWNAIPSLFTGVANGIIDCINKVFGTNIPHIDKFKMPTLQEMVKAVKDWWDNDGVRKAVEGAVEWVLGIFGVPKEKAEQVSKIVGDWFDGVKDAVEGACTWFLKLFTDVDGAAADAKDAVGTWWNGVVGGVESACSWFLQAFGVPQEKADEAAGRVGNWFRGVGPAIEQACNWVLEFPSTPTGQAIDNFVKTVGDWWTQDIVGLFEGITKIPSYIDEPQLWINDISDWWEGFKARFGQLTFDIIPNLLEITGIAGWVQDNITNPIRRGIQPIIDIFERISNFNKGLGAVTNREVAATLEQRAVEQANTAMREIWSQLVAQHGEGEAQRLASGYGITQSDVQNATGIESARALVETLKKFGLDNRMLGEAESTINTYDEQTKAIDLLSVDLTNLGADAESASQSLSTFSAALEGFNPGSTPGNAPGLSYVPYDNYLTRLHRGEQVLSRFEAQDYRKQLALAAAGGGDSLSFGDIIVNNDMDVQAMMAQIAELNRRTRRGYGS